MNHPPLTGHGDPGNYASATAANNIEYPAIEAANNTLPTIFENCIMEATGVVANEGTPNLQCISLESALGKTDSNAAKMAFEGRFTGAGFTADPYLLAPAYTSLQAAMESGELAQLEAWYVKHYTGSDANFTDFLRPLMINETVQAAQAAVLQAAVNKLPKI